MGFRDMLTKINKLPPQVLGVRAVGEVSDFEHLQS